MSQSELSQAIARHEGYLQADPDNVTLSVALGDLYREAGRYDEAMSRYQRCIELAPGAAPARSRQALTMIALQQHERAESVLRDLLADEPDSAVLMHNLGIALQGQGCWEAAAEAFAEAESKGLALPANYYRMAMAFRAAGNQEKAKAACERWCQKPFSRVHISEGQGVMAALMLEEGDQERAEQFAKSALQLNPNDIEANIVQGTLELERQNPDLARQHYQGALHQNDRNGRAWFGVGLSYLQGQQYNLAAAAVSKAKELEPNSVGIATTLGWVKLVLNDLTTAQAAFEAAVATNRSFAEAHGGLAVALALSGQAEAARRHIELARRLDRTAFGAEFAHVVLLASEDHQGDSAAHLSALLNRPVREGGMTLAEHLRGFPGSRVLVH